MSQKERKRERDLDVSVCVLITFSEAFGWLQFAEFNQRTVLWFSLSTFAWFTVRSKEEISVRGRVKGGRVAGEGVKEERERSSEVRVEDMVR